MNPIIKTATQLSNRAAIVSILEQELQNPKISMLKREYFLEKMQLVLSLDRLPADEKPAGGPEKL